MHRLPQMICGLSIVSGINKNSKAYLCCTDYKWESIAFCGKKTNKFQYCAVVLCSMDNSLHKKISFSVRSYFSGHLLKKYLKDALAVIT